MTSSIGLLTVFADLVILLVLVMVLANSTLSQLARPLIAWFALAIRAGGPSLSANSRSTLPCASARGNRLWRPVRESFVDLWRR